MRSKAYLARDRIISDYWEMWKAALEWLSYKEQSCDHAIWCENATATFAPELADLYMDRKSLPARSRESLYQNKSDTLAGMRHYWISFNVVSCS